MQNYYIDDKELTKQLLQEIQEKKDGKRKMISEELTKQFLLIVEKILTSNKFSRYSDDWKNDFRSKANELFVKHWYKFNPEKIRNNKKIVNGILELKKENEFIGAFSWFSLLIHTAILDEIKKRKKERKFLEELAKEKLNELKN